MHWVLYALSVVAVVTAVITSLVTVRRAHAGFDLDLEVTATGRLDTRLARAHDVDRSFSTAA